MALLMEHQFRQLPADRQVETRPFLEAVSYLPPFFGECFFHCVTLWAPLTYEVMWKNQMLKLVVFNLSEAYCGQSESTENFNT